MIYGISKMRNGLKVHKNEIVIFLGQVPQVDFQVVVRLENSPVLKIFTALQRPFTKRMM